MVDLALLQSVSYIAGAFGVFLGAVYYINNMRYTLNAREIDVCQYYVAEISSEPAVNRWSTVYSMKWSDPDDFWEKYGPTNPELFQKWTSQFLAYQYLAYLIQKKLAKPETVYEMGTTGAILLWEKYKDVIEARRKIQGQDWMAGFEFLANEMTKVKLRRDPSLNLENYHRNYM